MKIKKYGVYCLIILSTLMLISCGGSAGSSGKGNTVYVSAGAKSASTFSINTTAKNTSTTYNQGSLDYTITATAYVVTSGISASSVVMDHATISYTPMDGNSPAIATWTKALGGTTIAPGSTADISLTVVDTPQMIYLFPLFGGDTTKQFRYQVNVTFSGYEVNSGQALTCTSAPGNFYVYSGPASLSASPSTISFSSSEGAGTAKTVTVYGGVTPYNIVNSDTTNFTATISGSTITVTRMTATATTATLTITDAAATSVVVSLTAL